MSGGHLISDFCTALGWVSEPEKHLQGCSMLAAQLLWGLWLELVGVLLAVPMLTQGRPGKNSIRVVPGHNYVNI